MRVVKKQIIDGIEYLPDIVDTTLFAEWEESQYKKTGTKEIRLVAGLYKALSERENYFQNNTPTALGNPEYNLLCGVVEGFLQGSEMYLDEDDKHFIVKRGKRTVLVVDKIRRTTNYYKEKREIEKVIADILGR